MVLGPPSSQQAILVRGAHNRKPPSLRLLERRVYERGAGNNHPFQRLVGDRTTLTVFVAEPPFVFEPRPDKRRSIDLCVQPDT